MALSIRLHRHKKMEWTVESLSFLPVSIWKGEQIFRNPIDFLILAMKHFASEKIHVGAAHEAPENSDGSSSSTVPEKRIGG